MEQTPNLGLNKPAQEDFYNVDDFNENADILDEAYKNGVFTVGEGETPDEPVKVDADTLGGKDRSYFGTKAEINAINQSLTEQEQIIEDIKKGKYAMPFLDFENPIFTYDKDHLLHTVTKDCYLHGHLSVSSAHITSISINGTTIAGCTSINALSTEINLRVKAGTVVELTLGSGGYTNSYLYELDAITD